MKDGKMVVIVVMKPARGITKVLRSSGRRRRVSQVQQSEMTSTYPISSPVLVRNVPMVRQGCVSSEEVVDDRAFRSSA